jgi:hypothetical protein
VPSEVARFILAVLRAIVDDHVEVESGFQLRAENDIGFCPVVEHNLGAIADGAIHDQSEVGEGSGAARKPLELVDEFRSRGWQGR